MRLATRLLLTILPSGFLILLVIGGWFLWERKRVLIPEMQQQTRAYARVLDIAFEYGVRELDSLRIAGMLERTAASSRITGVRVYGATGELQYASRSALGIPPVSQAQLARVLGGMSELFFEREVNTKRQFTVLRAIREPNVNDMSAAPSGRVLGAIEVLQPYDALLAEVRQLELEMALATLLLILSMALIVAVVSRRTISDPLERLVAVARALGEGDTEARVPNSLGSAEPDALAREFNLMAERLAAARQELLQQGEERVRLERRLAQAERLAAVGTIAAGIAHEIGAPLNVISGRAEMLMRQSETPPALNRHLESIVAQSARITRTVRGLLDYAKRPTRRNDPVRIGRLIEETLELLQPECERGGATVIFRAMEEIEVPGDVDQLQQVVTNLLLNAVQAMDGELHNDGGKREGRRELVISATREGGWLQLTFLDTGPGLSPELDGKLFTPFATTKPRGTGLGLVVARGIVQDHGGTLDGTNREDGVRGARFTVRLPLAGASTPELSAFTSPLLHGHT